MPFFFKIHKESNSVSKATFHRALVVAPSISRRQLRRQQNDNNDIQEDQDTNPNENDDGRNNMDIVLENSVNDRGSNIYENGDDNDEFHHEDESSGSKDVESGGSEDNESGGSEDVKNGGSEDDESGGSEDLKSGGSAAEDDESSGSQMDEMSVGSEDNEMSGNSEDDEMRGDSKGDENGGFDDDECMMGSNGDECSGSNDDVDNNQLMTDKAKINQCFVVGRFTRFQGNLVLNLLKNLNASNLSHLPNDVRSVKTPVSKLPFQGQLEYKKICGGEYVYIGIGNNLKLKNCYFFENSDDSIELTFNTDGVPLAKSSSGCFWPILGKCSERCKVFLIALFYGPSKPTDFDIFITDFVEEANVLIETGIIIEGEYYSFRVKILAADTPAKADVLQCKAPTGFHSCTKCKVVGTRKETHIQDASNATQFRGHIQRSRIHKKAMKLKVKKSNIHFVTTDAPPREHNDYKKINEPAKDGDTFHHKRPKLADLKNFDLVKDVVVDGMHCIVGIAKKIVLTYIQGFNAFGSKKNRRAIIGLRDQKFLSMDLSTLHKFCPIEFARKPRSLKFINQWKSSEFKQFVQYTGVVLMKKYLPENYYENWTIFCVIVRLLSSKDVPRNEDMCEYIETLCKYFLKNLAEIYDDTIITHVVHLIYHLCRDWLRFGPIDSFSCYTFEDFNFHLVSNNRSGNRPLQQVVNRYRENIAAGVYMKEEEKQMKQKNAFDRRLTKNSFTTKGYTFRMDREGDQYCSIGPDVPVKIKSKDPTTGVITGLKFCSLQPLFKWPCNSSEVHIYKCNPSNTKTIKFYTEDIVGKYYPVPRKNKKLVLVKLLH